MDYRRWLRLRPGSEADVQREIDDELEAHLAMRTEDLERGGNAPDRARVEALRRFGDYREARAELIETAMARRRRRAVVEWLDTVRQDAEYARRRASRAPGYALFAVGILAAGIGLATSAFTVMDGVLLKSLPFAEPDRIYALTTLDSALKEVPAVSAADWAEWHDQSRMLESSALYRTFRTPVITGPEAIRSTVAYVTADFFQVLSTPFHAGHAFTDAEAQAGASGAIVSEGFWRGQLGGRALPIQITVGSRAMDVTGIIAAGYEYPFGTEIWVAERYRRDGGMYRNFINYSAIGRLAPGVTKEQADRELDAIAARIRERDPAALYSWGVELRSLKDEIVGDAATYLPILMAAVGFVLLIACANLAGLNLARGSVRTHELTVRASLGASRARLVRQLLVEHVFLSLVGGAVGVLLAWWLTRGVATLAAEVVPRAAEIRIDRTVLGFALFTSIACGVLTGALPALLFSRAALREQLASRTEIRASLGLPGSALVALEVATALVLLAGGMLLVRSYQSLLRNELGFDTRNVIAAQIVLSGARYPDGPAKLQYWDRLTEELRGIPGVQAAGVANWIPLGTGAMTFIEAEGISDPNSGGGYRAVGEDYFRAIGIPLLAGRMIERGDDAGTQRVAVVNRALAEKIWGGANPIGRRVRAPVTEAGPNQAPAPWLTVVGMVGDVRHWGIDHAPTPELYVAYRQVPVHALSMSAVVRAGGSVAPVLASVRDAIRRTDPQTPADVQTLHQRLNEGLRVRQLMTALLSVFGVLALALAALGLYSLLAFTVAARTREIAVRIALGARQTVLVRMVFANAMLTVCAGAILGLCGAILLTRFLSQLLVQVSPTDPVTLVAVTLTLLAAASIATLAPAIRAARLSPLLALQSD